MGVFNEEICFVGQDNHGRLICKSGGKVTDGATELIKGSHFSVMAEYVDRSFESNTKTTTSAYEIKADT